MTWGFCSASLQAVGSAALIEKIRRREKRGFFIAVAGLKAAHTKLMLPFGHGLYSNEYALHSSHIIVQKAEWISTFKPLLNSGPIASYPEVKTQGLNNCQTAVSIGAIFQ
jgi:hypothetical protein